MRPLLLLHGFTGAPDAWDDVVAHLPKDARAIRPTLGGHAGTPPPRSFEDEVDRLAGALRAEGAAGAHVSGYSLGGRLAFGLLARHPRLVSGATILSANPGLSSDVERTARGEADERWAELIERDFAAFVDAWDAQPLFAARRALAPTLKSALCARRLRHVPKDLARALRSLGLARMPDYAPALARVDLPIALVTGARDAKFTALAASLVGALRQGEHVVVAEAGHDLTLERPEAVAELLTRAVDR